MTIGKITIAVALAVVMALCHVTANAQRVLSKHEMDSITALLPNMPENDVNSKTTTTSPATTW